MIAVSARFRRYLAPAVGLLLALLAGCAAQTQALRHEAPTDLPRRIELAQTPFVAQERYQCGPAALAMALGAAGLAVNAEALVPEVYLPQRQGSLQVEMLAAARRHGAVSMTIPTRLDALLAEVAAGNPVVVLQNLGLSWYPLWHYAVVVGYDLDQGEIVLRSGDTERLPMPLSTFEHTWDRSQDWGMVALPPGRLPKTAEEETAAPALVAFEHGREPVIARRAYQAAVARWPDNLTLLLGLGNAAYAAGDRPAAADAFERAANAHPNSAPALNNLASVLAELGQFDQARRAARQALALDSPWRDTARATLQGIDAAEHHRTPH